MNSDANSSLSPDLRICVSNIPSRSIFTAWVLVYLLFLPVFLYVLYIGFNKWKKPQSSASGGLSHSDVFTLNMVAMEMTSIIGSWVSLKDHFSSNSDLTKVGAGTVLITATAQMLFHSLTCVERYLAVVHPVTYLRLRGEGGVTIRNISIAVVWMMSIGLGLTPIILNKSVVFAVFGFIASILPLPVVAYCSICVLCVLIRPKPGEGGGLRKPIAQSKRSTFLTMVAILTVLLLRFIVQVVISGINLSFWRNIDLVCVMSAVSLWGAVPSSLVLPLLFLHRHGTRSKARK